MKPTSPKNALQRTARCVTFDDSEPYDLNIWVESTKSLESFEQSLAAVIAPLAIRDHKFSLGEIDCAVQVVREGQPSSFPGIPVAHYSFRINVSDHALELLGAFRPRLSVRGRQRPAKQVFVSIPYHRRLELLCIVLRHKPSVLPQ